VCQPQQARTLIDEHILETGNILLQGLPITTPEACEAFVNGMAFTRQKYEPYGGVRQKVQWMVGRPVSDMNPVGACLSRAGQQEQSHALLHQGAKHH
jgi:hypothetical protein